MTDANAATASESRQHDGVERRRAPLPQPNFAPYQKANAYPGQSFFFVGHSYDVELDGADSEARQHRSKAITNLFNAKPLLQVPQALANEEFTAILTRFEKIYCTACPKPLWWERR